jgi:hypothetical protein
VLDEGAEVGSKGGRGIIPGIKKPACGRRYFRNLPRFCWVPTALMILSPQLSPHLDGACFLSRWLSAFRRHASATVIETTVIPFSCLIS